MKLLIALLVTVCMTAQSKPPATQHIDVPSDAEINELLSKATQKVAAFQETVNAAKPILDKINPKLSVNYLDTATTAQTMIKATQQNGPSAYRLVGLLATLDDLTIGSANASIILVKSDEEQIIKGRQADPSRLALALQFEGIQSGCNDISELVMHSTLRLIAAEEAILDKLSNSQ
jgi:hypothetical protein